MSTEKAPYQTQALSEHQQDRGLYYGANQMFIDPSAYNTRPIEASPSDLPPPSYDDSNNHHALASPSPSHPVTSRSDSMSQKPIAIPATNPKIGSPFLRAYPPVLMNYKLPKESFLTFLDNLNRIAVASPPVQILGLAGNIVSFVPLATAQIVGTAVGAAATLTTVAMSKGRTEMYMREANRDIFGPRGLKVEIAKLDALAKVAGIPILNPSGKIDKNAPLLTPLEDVYEVNNLSGQQRRLNTLRPWIADLEVEDLGQVNVPDNAFSRFNAGASERVRRRGEAKMLKRRVKAHAGMEKEINKAMEDYNKHMRELDEDEAKVRRKEAHKPEKLNKELAKIQMDRRKVEQDYEKDMREIDQDRVKDDKEEKGMRKILWLIIRELDADSGTGPLPDQNGP